MFDFDPRDADDSRDRDDRGRRPDHKWREPAEPAAADDGHDRNLDDEAHDVGQRDKRGRDDENGGPRLGRGSSSQAEKPEFDPRSRDDERWPDRDRDPQQVFMRNLNLPRGRGREVVHDGRHGEYSLRGSETRTLATVGAFRVVSAGDLRNFDGKTADPRVGDLRHLRDQGLIRVERVPGNRDPVVALTDRARDLLRANQVDQREGNRQAFYSGLVKAREVEHDAQLYRAYVREAAKVAKRGGRVDRVLLDYELKSEYQRWLHARDGDRDRVDGRPDREAYEVEDWARERDLPYFDDQVHFPDLRIEYRDADGRLDHLDVEVTTMHYRGAHGAAAARSGFSCYRGRSGRLGGGGGRGSGHRGGLAEELWE